MTYERAAVAEIVTRDEAALFAPYATGRPSNWSCDRATRDLVCVGNWLDAELAARGANDDDRRIMLWTYNRRSRASFDVFQLGADIMNEFDAGIIDRKPAHRRWG